MINAVVDGIPVFDGFGIITFGEYTGWAVDADDALWYHEDNGGFEVHVVLPRDKAAFEATHPGLKRSVE